MSTANFTTLSIMDNPSAPLTMSSLEIAGLVESRHDNVKRAIERCAKSGVIRLPPTEVSEKINNLGLPSKVTVYNLEKRDSIVVVAQLSPEFTGRLVDRWLELEEPRDQSMMSTEALLVAVQKLVAVEREQVRQAARLSAVENRVRLLGSDTGYRTVTAHAKIVGRKLPLREAVLIGKAATKLCKDFGMTIGNVPDERFGSVNSYPIEVMDEVFADANEE